MHPNLYPQVAPISYSRAHPMTDDDVPGNKDLRYLVEGWGRAVPAVSYYLYCGSWPSQTPQSVDHEVADGCADSVPQPLPVLATRRDREF